MKLLFTLIAVLLHSFLPAQNLNLVWAKNMGGTAVDRAHSVAVDAFGNVYTTGFFDSTADFDPGPGTAYLTAEKFGNWFVSKLDAAGNFVWAKQVGGTHDDVISYSIALDVAGNIYTTGYFSGTVDFDPGAGTTNLTTPAFDLHIFVSKLDAYGNFVWAKNMGGNTYAAGQFYSRRCFG